MKHLNDMGRFMQSAFTMAEILLSLTIIGVVAAITLPSLTGNINERTWNTQRKALYARFSQAMALMPSLNGYGTLSADESGSITEDNIAETFITAGLSTVLKINNICDSDHLQDCGIPEKFTTLVGGTVSEFPKDLNELNSGLVSYSYSIATTGEHGSYSYLNAKAAAFETANGESIAVFYKNNCIADQSSTTHFEFIQPYVCANFIYDLNGTKGPNTVGKDMGFMTVLYPTDSLVAAPVPHPDSGKSNLTLSEGRKYCTSLSDEYRIPNKEEAASMYVNKAFIGNNSSCWLMTSSKTVDNGIWFQSVLTGNRIRGGSGASTDYFIRCVKR